MKKSLVGIICLLLIVGFSSCKKCQTCTTKTSQDVQGTLMENSTSADYCGKTYDDAPAESSVTQNANGVTQTVTITCTEN